MVAFWREAGHDKWFCKDDGFDGECRDRFGAAMRVALAGGLDDLRATPEGALALLLLLDQFPRNTLRGRAEAFSGDGRARDVAREALSRGFDLQIPKELQVFAHLPFMHSENLADQELMVALARWRHDADTLKFAEVHRDIIAEFGRFPHRNVALGRSSTAAEAAFLARPDAFKG